MDDLISTVRQKPEQPFIHQTLQSCTDEIRLLKLKRGSIGTVKCEIYHADFNDVHLFRAVSYVWGPPNPQRRIQINGKDFYVRGNLWRFLNTLRQRADFDDKTPLWIDQICIDQSTIEERNHQVQLMGRIYYEAFEVLVWLGESSSDSNVAVSAITNSQTPDPKSTQAVSVSDIGPFVVSTADRQPASAFWVSPTTLSPRMEPIVSFMPGRVVDASAEAKSPNPSGIIGSSRPIQFLRTSGRRLANLLDTTAQASKVSPKYAVQRLLSRPYWSRLWIIQELLLGQFITLFCGKDRFTLAQLQNYLSVSEDLPYQKTVRNLIYQKQNMCTERQWRQGESLCNILFNFCGGECQDVRDKVFGLQALVTERERLQVDYKASTEEVFAHVFRKLLGLDDESRSVPSDMRGWLLRKGSHETDFFNMLARSLQLPFQPGEIRTLLNAASMRSISILRATSTRQSTPQYRRLAQQMIASFREPEKRRARRRSKKPTKGSITPRERAPTVAGPVTLPSPTGFNWI